MHHMDHFYPTKHPRTISRYAISIYCNYEQLFQKRTFAPLLGVNNKMALQFVQDW